MSDLIYLLLILYVTGLVAVWATHVFSHECDMPANDRWFVCALWPVWVVVVIVISICEALNMEL